MMKDLKVIPASARIFKDKNLQLFRALKAQKTEMFHFHKVRPEVQDTQLLPSNFPIRQFDLE